MPKSIEYIGTVRGWPELPITGRQSVWFPGQIEQRSDTEAAALLATGQFSDQDAVQLPDEKLRAISGVVSGGGNRRVLRSLAVIGDSLSAFGTNPALPAGVGAWDCTGISTLNASGTWIGSPSLDGRAPTGAAGTLSTDGAGRLRWQHNADAAPGPWVDVSMGGFYEIPAVTAQRGLFVAVNSGYQLATTASDALTTSGIVKRAHGPSHTYSEMLRDVLGPGVQVSSFGISGDLIASFAGRWRQVFANGSPDAVVVLIGTNNTPVTTAAAIANADATIAVLRQMAGLTGRVYVGGMFPRTDTATAGRNALAIYSDRLRQFCETTAGFRYWDAWPVLVSGSATDGSLKSGAYHTDNLHLMPFGAWLAKNVIHARLGEDFSLPSAAESARGYVAWDNVSRNGSVNANPRLKGSGGTGSGAGGVTGVVPASWGVTRSAGTQTCALSTATNADDQDSLILTIADSTSAANNNTSDYHEIAQTVTLPAGLGAGNFVAFELDLEVQSATGLQRLEAAMLSNGNTQSAYWGLSSRTWSNFGSTVTHRARIRSERLLLLSGTTSITMRLRIGTANAGAAVLAIRRFELLEA